MRVTHRSFAGHPAVAKFNSAFSPRGTSMRQTAHDIEYLRHRLADRLDEHPVREWSAPLLTAVIGLLDAHAISVEMALHSSKPRLRLVDVAAVEALAEVIDQGVVAEII